MQHRTTVSKEEDRIDAGVLTCFVPKRLGNLMVDRTLHHRTTGHELVPSGPQTTMHGKKLRGHLRWKRRWDDVLLAMHTGITREDQIGNENT